MCIFPTKSTLDSFSKIKLRHKIILVKIYYILADGSKIWKIYTPTIEAYQVIAWYDLINKFISVLLLGFKRVFFLEISQTHYNTVDGCKIFADFIIIL